MDLALALALICLVAGGVGAITWLLEPDERPGHKG